MASPVRWLEHDRNGNEIYLSQEKMGTYHRSGIIILRWQFVKINCAARSAWEGETRMFSTHRSTFTRRVSMIWPRTILTS